MKTFSRAKQDIVSAAQCLCPGLPKCAPPGALSPTSDQAATAKPSGGSASPLHPMESLHNALPYTSLLIGLTVPHFTDEKPETLRGPYWE